MSNTHNDTILENLFEKYLELTDNEELAEQMARREFEELCDAQTD